MCNDWSPQETNTHQDHVIAHVVGTTVLGWFIFDEVAYLILNIGFIWITHLDGEMGMVPQSVFISDLTVSPDTKLELDTEVDALRNESAQAFEHITPAPRECVISDVMLESRGGDVRIRIKGEDSNLEIVSSLQTREFEIAIT